ncbi:MAG: Holliday junction branch migration protein RuvA [Planctomycetota bacterium]|nr:Holliday junction branch migration protein RuvA [Planctomycetota bacterium]
MYDFLRGRIAATGAAHVVLDVGGVGWLLHVPASLALRLRAGEDTRLLVHLSVSESAHTLYGFERELERRLFRRLIQVSGVGPSRALEVMSSLPTEPLVRAIIDGDVQRLTAVRGVGRKTAERLVVELRDRLREWTTGSEDGAEATAGVSAPELADDLARVLMDLGSLQAVAQRAADQARAALGTDADFQELLRHALRSRT